MILCNVRGSTLSVILQGKTWGLLKCSLFMEPASSFSINGWRMLECAECDADRFHVPFTVFLNACK